MKLNGHPVFCVESHVMAVDGIGHVIPKITKAYDTLEKALKEEGQYSKSNKKILSAGIQIETTPKDEKIIIEIEGSSLPLHFKNVLEAINVAMTKRKNISCSLILIINIMYLIIS